MSIRCRFTAGTVRLPTPQCDELERLRKYFKQKPSPVYNDCLRLARKLEQELLVANFNKWNKL